MERITDAVDSCFFVRIRWFHVVVVVVAWQQQYNKNDGEVVDTVK